MISPQSSIAQIDDDSVHLLADQFLHLHRTTADASVDQFVAAHPDVADELKQAIEDLLFAEALLSDRAPTSPPRCLGGYDIEHEIGRGGMGVVYAATDPLLGRKLAVKTVLHATPTHQVRFEREAKLTSRLNHRNIVPLLEYGQQDGICYFVMPLIEGNCLSCNVARRNVQGDTGPLQPPAGSFADNEQWHRLARIGADVAAALEYAHYQGTIHRDIKPGNLILDANDHIWVTDFGLAKPMDDICSRTGTIAGTYRYMAPEQLRGRGDARSDIFALGLTLYELATGVPVWQASGAIDPNSEPAAPALSSIRTVSPQVPPELAKIIMRACALDPARRFQTAEQMRRALNQFAHCNHDRRADQRNKSLRVGDWLLIPILLGLLSVGLNKYLSIVMERAVERCVKQAQFPHVLTAPDKSPEESQVGSLGETTHESPGQPANSVHSAD